MKLLLDQNLSPRLVGLLSERFPASLHVRDLELQRADDAEVWDYAKDNGFAIVSKDADFHQLSFLHGHPPKVVWLRIGNCSTGDAATLLSDSHEELEAFDAHPEASFLVLP